MGELSPMHWLVIVAVIVLLFGPKRIPDVMRGLGEGVRGFKEGMRDEPRPTQTSTTEIPPADAALPARRTPPVSLGSRTNSVPSDSNNVARGGIS